MSSRTRSWVSLSRPVGPALGGGVGGGRGLLVRQRPVWAVLVVDVAEDVDQLLQPLGGHELRERGITLHELEIPHGPCASFTGEDGQRFAVYELIRSEAVSFFDGRIDP